MISKKGRLLGLTFAIALSAFGLCSLAPTQTFATCDPSVEDCCTTIIDGGMKCGDITEKSITDLVEDVVRFLIRGVGILGAIGVFVAGFYYLTARDNEAQVAKAKKRFIEVVIGILAYGIFWVAYELLVPATGDAKLDESKFTSYKSDAEVAILTELPWIDDGTTEAN